MRVILLDSGRVLSPQPRNPHKTDSLLDPSGLSSGAKVKQEQEGKNDLTWKEKLAARGFVSDVTVKRKQEALQNELEITREEKKKAEEKLREMEEEHKYQREMEKRDLERRAQEREKNLEAQIQMLKQQLESHCSQLQDNQKLLTSLQSELAKVKGRNHSNPDKDSRVCAVM